MTQIVYYKNQLYADRQAYYQYGNKLKGQSKIQFKTVGDVRMYWACCGSFEACQLCDEIINSDFDPEVVDRARAYLADKDVGYDCVLITEPLWNRAGERKVFLVNPKGFKSEVSPDQPIVLGANSEAIIGAIKALEHYNVEFDLDEMVKAVTSMHTNHHEYQLCDCIELNPRTTNGVYRENL